jgi:hypothetical protein
MTAMLNREVAFTLRNGGVMNTRKVSDVKQATREVIWHIRLAAITFQHAIGEWEEVVVLHLTTAENVQEERKRCMNQIGALCDRLTKFLGLMNSREEVSPEAFISRLIESCDTAIEDLRVGPAERLMEPPPGEPPSESP